MSASTKESKKETKNDKLSHDREVEVLYQKMGETWYAFSLIEDEVFFSPVPEAAIHEIQNKHPFGSGR